MTRFTARAPDLVFELIQRHGIACKARRSGWIDGTPYVSGMRSMEKRCKLARTGRAGGGTLNPLSYNRGLAAAAIGLGAVFHGDVEARGLAMGTTLGRALARRVRGETVQDIGFPVTSARLPLGLSSIGR